jgi:hypothetical protein
MDGVAAGQAAQAAQVAAEAARKTTTSTTQSSSPVTFEGKKPCLGQCSGMTPEASAGVSFFE